MVTKRKWTSILMEYIKTYYFIIGTIFFTGIKILLAGRLPAAMIIRSYHDDLLMVRMGNSILDGNWLGAYDSNTLVKGMMYPLFLAVSNKMGFTYHYSLTLLYVIACMIFCAAISHIVKKKGLLLLLYIVLLFNPASMDVSSFQRIYRCSLTPAQVLMVFGGFWGLYFSVCRKNKTGVGWALLAGMSLFFFWNTREDSVWMLPFVGVLTVVSLITFIYNKVKAKNRNKWNIATGIFVLLLPILVLKCGNLLIAYENNTHYGIFTVNELNDSNFSEVMKCLYAVEPKEDIQWVSVTREKLQRIYEVSPSLCSIQEILEERMDDWDHLDRTPGDHEVENGWFFWALRDAVQRAGYYKSAKSADDFYGNVADEIKSALDCGTLEAQKTMPSALMPPWKAAYIKEFLYAVKESVLYLFQFLDTEAQYWVSEVSSREDYEIYQEFHRLTRSPISINVQPDIKNMQGLNASKSDVHPFDYEKYVGRVNRIVGLYQKFNMIFGIVAGLFYLYLLMLVFRRAGSDRWIGDQFLILTSFIASLLVLVFGVSYNHTFSCNSIHSLYYSGAYSLILAYEGLAFCFGSTVAAQFIHIRKMKDGDSPWMS